MEHTFIINTEDTPGVLHRISAIFTRRKVNIESLSVSKTKQEHVSRITIVVNQDKDSIGKLMGQLNKIIEVLEIDVHASQNLTYREVAMFKVAGVADDHNAIGRIAAESGASFVFESRDEVTVEKNGTEEEIETLYAKLSGYAIREFIRTGRVALLRAV